jgi:hypothetical protein
MWHVKALPGNGSINTPRYMHATIERMFIARCYATVSTPMDWRESYHVPCFLCGLRYSTIELCFLRCPCRGCITRVPLQIIKLPCGGGVEYLHCDPASRRRRRKGKSRVWDSKIWSRVPRDSDLRKTALARASSIHKRQTRPLVREGAPQKQDRKCQTIKNIWSWAPNGGSTPKLTDWLIVSRNVTLTLTSDKKSPGGFSKWEYGRGMESVLSELWRLGTD